MGSTTRQLTKHIYQHNAFYIILFLFIDINQVGWLKWSPHSHYFSNHIPWRRIHDYTSFTRFRRSLSLIQSKSQFKTRASIFKQCPKSYNIIQSSYHNSIAEITTPKTYIFTSGSNQLNNTILKMRFESGDLYLEMLCKTFETHWRNLFPKRNKNQFTITILTRTQVLEKSCNFSMKIPNFDVKIHKG